MKRGPRKADIGSDRIRERIKELVDSRRLTLRELEKQIGSSKTWLSQALSGKKALTEQTLAKLAAVLGCSPDLFFTQPGNADDGIRAFERCVLTTPLLSHDERRSLLSKVHALPPGEVVKLIKARERLASYPIIMERMESERKLALPTPNDEDASVTHLDTAHRIRILRFEVIAPEFSCLLVRSAARSGGRGAKYLNPEQELLESQCEVPGGGRFLPAIGRHEPDALEVHFDPPLRAGHKACIAVRESYQRTYAATLECLQKLTANRQRRETAPIQLAGFTCKYPAKLLINRLILPPGFEPVNFSFTVEHHNNQIREEEARIRDSFTARRNEQGAWVLELSVDDPITGARYSISFVPPFEEDYLKVLREPGVQR